jgi:hypothetical protein
MPAGCWAIRSSPRTCFFISTTGCLTAALWPVRGGTALVNVAAAGLIGMAVTARSGFCRLGKAAVLAGFGAAGLSGALMQKVFWTLGLSDSFVTIGAVLTIFGMARVTGGTQLSGLIVMLPGTMLGALSFGSGIMMWPPFVLGLLLLRQPLAAGIYAVGALATAASVMVDVPPLN